MTPPSKNESTNGLLSMVLPSSNTTKAAGNLLKNLPLVGPVLEMVVDGNAANDGIFGLGLSVILVGVGIGGLILTSVDFGTLTAFALGASRR